jgi:hypothetical protein
MPLDPDEIKQITRMESKIDSICESLDRTQYKDMCKQITDTITDKVASAQATADDAKKRVETVELDLAEKKGERHTVNWIVNAVYAIWMGILTWLQSKK